MVFVNRQEYVLSNLRENVEMSIYTIIAFFIPFLLGHPQMLVGVIVNASLVIAALNLNNQRLLPIILAPSLGVLSRGLIFGPFTVYLLYMIPFIWIGNSILVLAFKLNKNRWISLITGSLVKTAFLFTAAFILVNIGIIPPVFLTTMGLFQLYTAIAGGLIAFGAHKIKS